MLIDFQAGTQGEDLTADVCVIGSGAAGITLAMEFDGSGRDVVVVTGGSIHHEPENQDLYRSRVAGLAHRGIHEGRARIHGGTTTLWAGQALPLDAIDFEPRDWVPHSGWPFRRDLLDPYYRRAERVMKIVPMTYDEHSWPPNRPAPPDFDPKVLHARISQFARQPNFAISYRDELARSGNVRVLMNAHAVGLAPAIDAGRLDRVEIKALSGKTASIRARYVVVCCGAIETARLLLASDSVDPRGVGNAHDLVGRYFQEHLQGRAARIVPADSRKLRATFLPFDFQGTRYAPKMCSGEALQGERKILNVYGDLCYEIPEDSAVDSAKLLVRSLRRKELRRKVPGALWNVARRPHEVAAAAARYALYREPMTHRKGAPFLGVQSEQQPNPDSRVTLGEERDALGMRRSVLDWRLSELDRRSLTVFVEAVAGEFRRLGLGTVDLSTFSLPDDLARMDETIIDSNHHIGTTRMHDDPRRGVVDRDCRVHGVENLFIGSSAVFPTGGASNPTLTIIALCLRIADRLKHELYPAPLAHSGRES